MNTADWQSVWYALPSLVSGVVAAVVALISWQRRHTARGATAFVIFALAVMVWMLGYALEIRAEQFSAKLFWLYVEYPGIALAPALWLLFTLSYTRRTAWTTPRVIAAVLIIPIITLLLAWTSRWHTLYWQSLTLNTQDYAVPLIEAVRGPWYWVNFVFGQGAALTGTVLIGLQVARTTGLFRRQATVLLIAALFPIVTNLLYVSGLNPWPALDLTPIGLSVTMILVAWALFSVRLFDIVPAARELALEHIDDAIFVVDEQNHVLNLNRAACALLGMPLSEAVGRRIDRICPEPLAGIERVLDGSLTRTDLEIDFNGVTHYFDLRITPLHSKRGTLRGRIGLLQDVTRSKQAEQAEREQRALAEALRDIAAALNSTLDLEEVLDRILENVERVVPHDAANIMLIEDGVATVVRARGYQKHGIEDQVLALRLPVATTRNLQHMVETGEPYLIADVHKHEEWVMLDETTWVHSYAAMPIRGDQGVIGFLNLDSATPGFYNQSYIDRLRVFADQVAIAVRNAHLYGESERRNRQLALLNEIARVGAVTLNLDDLLASLAREAAHIIGGDGCYITLWDEAARRAIPAAAWGAASDVYRSLPVQPGDLTFTEKVLEAGEPLVVEDVPSSPFASAPHLDLSPVRSVLALPLRADGHDLGALLLSFENPHHFSEQEITWAAQAADLIALAVAKAQAYAEVEARNRDLDAFSHTVAHDLRAPIGTLLGFMDLIIYSEGERLTDEGRDMLARVERSAHKMAQIVDSLLLLAQLRGAPEASAAVAMQPVIEAAVERFRRDIDAHGIQIEIAPDLPPVIGYGPWLEEVFANLINNAVKFIGASNPAPCITISALPLGKQVRYQVTDNGQGIPISKQSELFRAFTQVHKGPSGGYGLGLSIVKGVIDKLGGEVGVESTPGKGSTFWFVLPAPD